MLITNPSLQFKPNKKSLGLNCWAKPLTISVGSWLNNKEYILVESFLRNVNLNSKSFMTMTTKDILRLQELPQVYYILLREPLFLNLHAWQYIMFKSRQQ